MGSVRGATRSRRRPTQSLAAAVTLLVLLFVPLAPVALLFADEPGPLCCRGGRCCCAGARPDAGSCVRAACHCEGESSAASGPPLVDVVLSQPPLPAGPTANGLLARVAVLRSERRDLPVPDPPPWPLLERAVAPLT